MSELLFPPAETKTILSLLNQIVGVLNKTIDLDTSIDLALRDLVNYFNISTAAVLIQSGKPDLKVAASIGIRIDTISKLSARLSEHNESVVYIPIKEKSTHPIKHIQRENHQEFSDPYLQFMLENGEEKALLIPLIKDNKALGICALHGVCNESFSETDTALLLTIGNQIALTIERFHLIQAEKDALQQAQALREIGTILSQSLDLDRILDQALQQIRRVVPFDSATVAQIQNGRTQVIRAHGYNRYGTHVEHVAWSQSLEIKTTGNLNKIYNTGKPLIVPDIQIDKEWIHTPEFSYIRSWLGAPIYVNNSVVAFIFLDKQESNFYTKRHAKALEAFATQLSLSLQNARLFDEKNRHANILASLNNLMHTIAGHHTVREVCMTTAKHVTDMFSHLNTTVLIYQPTTLDFIVEGFFGLDGKQRSIGDITENKFALEAINSGEIKIATSERDLEYKLKDFNTALTKSICAIPLRIGREKIGILLTESNRSKSFHHNNTSILETIADQLAQSIQKARLIEETKRDASDMDSIYKTSAAIRDAKTIAGISSNIVKQCSTMFHASGSSLMLVIDSGDLRITAVHPPRPDSIGAIYPKGHGIVNHVAKTRQMYIAEDVPNDPLTYRPKQDSRRFTGAQTSISIPLQNNERLIGVLNIWFKDAHFFEPREIRYLSTVADIATNALERGLLLEHLEHRITERTKELENANIRLHELDQLKSKFITEITHELRTPITALNLHLDLLQRGKEAKREKYMTVLRKQVKRLEDLVNNAISVSRLDVEKESSNFIQLDFNELIKGMIETLHQDKRKTVIWRTQFDQTAAPIWGEPSQLSQMVRHILKNSIDYTTEGSITISTEIVKTQTHLRFCVEDTGQGIPASDLPHVFDRFYRSGETTNVAGSGLGLALVKEIVAIHNGSVQIESNEGVGTHLCVELPIQKPSQRLEPN